MKKYNKYNNIKTVFEGKRFDSKKEMYRYIYLKDLANKGLIGDLQCQPVFELQEKFKLNGKKYRAIKYIADFSYLDFGERVIEDVKSVATMTPLYKLKKKMFMYRYGITITEII